MQMNKNIIAGCLLITLGIVINCFAYKNLRYSEYFYKNAISTTGTITEIKEVKKKKTFAPIFTYKDQNNVEQKSISYVTSNPNKYSLGQEVEILFDPINPAYSKIKDEITPLTANLMPFFFGVIICIIGGIVTKSK